MKKKVTLSKKDRELIDAVHKMLWERAKTNPDAADFMRDTFRRDMRERVANFTSLLRECGGSISARQQAVIIREVKAAELARFKKQTSGLAVHVPVA